MKRWRSKAVLFAWLVLLLAVSLSCYCSDSDILWHWFLASSVFQCELKPIYAQGFLHAFSTRLGRQKHPDVWTE